MKVEFISWSRSCCVVLLVWSLWCYYKPLPSSMCSSSGRDPRSWLQKFANDKQTQLKNRGGGVGCRPGCLSVSWSRGCSPYLFFFCILILPLMRNWAKTFSNGIPTEGKLLIFLFQPRELIKWVFHSSKNPWKSFHSCFLEINVFLYFQEF